MSKFFKENQLSLVVTIVAIEFISGFTQGFYEPLIPTFAKVLDVSASDITLFNTVPTLVAAVLVPILTKLGDTLGYRKMLRIVITIIFVATAIIALGSFNKSWPMVLFGRLLNGPIAVWLPLHIALVHSKSSTSLSARKAVSIIIATLTVGTVLGTASSGVIYNLSNSLAHTSIIPIVLVFIAVLLVWIVMPEHISGLKNDIDWRGFATLAVIMLVTMVGFVEVVGGGIDTAIGIAALLIGGLIGYFWYRYERKLSAVPVGAPKRREPAIDTNIIFSKSLAPLYLVAIFYGIVFYGFLSPLATFLAADPATYGYGFGLSASLISAVQTGILIMTVIAALVVSTLIGHLGPKLTLIIGALSAIGAFALLIFSGVFGFGGLIVFVIFAGLGLGVISAAIPVLIPESAPEGQKGIATGLFNSSQTLGGAFGGGLFLALLKLGATGSESSLFGYNTVWFTCALALAIALVAFTISYKPPAATQNV
jgi:MFS family permease